MTAHIMRGPCSLPSDPPSGGYGCSCGAGFVDYAALAEHVRMTIACPRCDAAPAPLRDGDLYRWTCGHWIAINDPTAPLRDDQGTPHDR